MIRLTVGLLSAALLALACGSGDSTSGGAKPDVSAQAQQVEAPSAPAAAPTEAPDPEALDPGALSCLDLVAKGRFQQAVAPCTAAVRANPANTELEAALDQAQSATKSMAKGAAEDAAKSQLDDATKGATDKLRY